MRVVGDERTLPLRHRLTNGLFAVVAVTALASAITNVALGLPAVTVIVTGITGGWATGGWFCGRAFGASCGAHSG